MDDLPPTADGHGIVFIDGKPFSFPINRTKSYVTTLERFGGKASVMFDRFDRWFASLWQGRALAFTVLWIAVIGAVVLFLIAGALPEDDSG